METGNLIDRVAIHCLVHDVIPYITIPPTDLRFLLVCRGWVTGVIDVDWKVGMGKREGKRNAIDEMCEPRPALSAGVPYSV